MIPAALLLGLFADAGAARDESPPTVAMRAAMSLPNGIEGEYLAEGCSRDNQQTQSGNNQNRQQSLPEAIKRY
jgi:hypothetical protein